MKSTESIDETAASTGRSLADGDAVSPSQTSLMDQRRRRLVRGAMAVAPLVLTLRSGALAAASCTGVKIASVRVSTGAGSERRGEIMNPPTPLANKDVCVAPGVLVQCPAPSVEKVLTSSPINATNSEEILFRDVAGTDYWTCGDRQFQGQNVAILSSASVASMGVAP
ncbi:hypothetical protein [Accumulibacter sp.]|uniref:Uncharacterized protein n=1 Tax=Accumulibacter regalis TaxID=522306 RepID=C7RTZ5_ACCRE|nr:hypothetical protein [Accumulibacter sp.]MBN8496105.1 hypothetical protein [Accumulibacter sp.]MBO3716132.1 hypothetical protein [Accumulibacter sp.]